MTRWRVSLDCVTLEVTVEADNADDARADGVDELRFSLENDLNPDNITVEPIELTP